MNYCYGWRQRVETPLIDDSNGVLHTRRSDRVGRKAAFGRWALHPHLILQLYLNRGLTCNLLVTANGNEYTSCLLSNLGLSGSLYLSKRPAAPVICRRNSHLMSSRLCKNHIWVTLCPAQLKASNTCHPRARRSAGRTVSGTASMPPPKAHAMPSSLSASKLERHLAPQSWS